FLSNFSSLVALERKVGPVFILFACVHALSTHCARIQLTLSTHTINNQNICLSKGKESIENENHNVHISYRRLYVQLFSLPISIFCSTTFFFVYRSLYAHHTHLQHENKRPQI